MHSSNRLSTARRCSRGEITRSLGQKGDDDLESCVSIENNKFISGWNADSGSLRCLERRANGLISNSLTEIAFCFAFSKGHNVH